MLISLVRKDLLIVKKYLLLMFIFAIVGPIFISSELKFLNGSFIGFLITVLFLEYIIFNSVSMAEDKYKGSALLCTTPYTRDAVVRAKYLFVLVIFIISLITYTLTASVTPLGLERLNITNVGISLLTLSFFFGVLIPVQFKFGYEKTKMFFFFVVFLTPFIFPTIVQWLQSHNLEMSIMLPLPHIIQVCLLYLISLLITFISMLLSKQIYAKKNL
ncbi:ABC-2 transporter permease [Paenibacillus anaericanus]|uniref:ABC-2 transporter permease n=1 Tax=Paenibacillus anaericanus TaxID=170367 RepID=A0A433YDU1_9BACL|nr:ABC-2 transporter permease [Paenibacillus anaericanus]RUT48032.1 ABC-2 transporter permease [Paenibacillus anaericanus]